MNRTLKEATAKKFYYQDSQVSPLSVRPYRLAEETMTDLLSIASTTR